MKPYSSSVYRLSLVIYSAVIIKLLILLFTLYCVFDWFNNAFVAELGVIVIFDIVVVLLATIYLAISLRYLFCFLFCLIVNNSYLLFLCYEYVHSTYSPVCVHTRKSLRRDVVIVDYLLVVMAESYFSDHKKALKGLSFSCFLRTIFLLSFLCLYL